MKRIWQTGIVLITFGFLNGLSAQDDLEKLLPGEDIKGNWKMEDSVKVYSDEDLYTYIDGGADIYLEYGFDRVLSCRYVNPTANRLHIEIYKMKDPDAAYGIFSLNSTGLGHPVDVGDEAFQYDYYMDIWKTSYFLRFTVTRKESRALDTLRLFASSIVEKIKGEGKKPELTSVLELKDKELKGLKYLRGQIALNNVFNFGHGSIAGFEEAVTAKSGELSFYVFKYKDDHTRREWFASAKGKMHSHRKFTDFNAVDDGFTVKDKYGKTFAFKPYREFFMIIYGLDWEQAQPVFEEMVQNIDQLYSN